MWSFTSYSSLCSNPTVVAFLSKLENLHVVHHLDGTLVECHAMQSGAELLMLV